MVCFLADRCQTSSNKPKLWKYVKHVLLKRALCEATLTATPENMIARSPALALHPAVLTYWDVGSTKPPPGEGPRESWEPS